MRLAAPRGRMSPPSPANRVATRATWLLLPAAEVLRSFDRFTRLPARAERRYSDEDSAWVRVETRGRALGDPDAGREGAGARVR